MSPHNPFRLWLKKVWRIVFRAGFKFHQIDGSARAASFSYYAFFALFPLILLLVSLGSAFLKQEEVAGQVVKSIEQYIPLSEEHQIHVEEAVYGALRARRKTSILAGVGLLWSASQLFHAMVRGVNTAWGTIEVPWWQVPLKSFIMLGLVVTALFTGILVPVIFNSLTATPLFGEQVFTGMFDLMSVLVPSLVLFCGLCLFYKLAPHYKTLFSEVVMPAFVVTILLQTCRGLFERYAYHFAHDNALHGTLAVVVILLMWIYLSGAIIIYGGCLCAVGRVSSTDQPPGFLPAASDDAA